MEEMIKPGEHELLWRGEIVVDVDKNVAETEAW